jgi:NitT/TauT family transport system ATP-binding protein
MKSLTIGNLAKTYFDPFSGSQVSAVRDISLTVDAGDFVSVVGPSGCGKTTLLNMIAGFLPASGGRVEVDGRTVSGPGPDRGVVFQSFALFPWRTVLDNVAFGPKMRGVAKAKRHEIAREYLALAGLSDAADRYPNELSGGMQQRVGVVRALANQPDVLLMDEPFASVDAQTRMTLQEELTRIWQDRRPTVLFITHDVAEAVFPRQPGRGPLEGNRVRRRAGALERPRSWNSLSKTASSRPCRDRCSNASGRHEDDAMGMTRDALRSTRGRLVLGFLVFPRALAGGPHPDGARQGHGRVQDQCAGPGERPRDPALRARALPRSGVPAAW